MRNKYQLTFICLSVILLSVSLNAAIGHGNKPHWTYEGDYGPERWGDLHPDFAIAKHGKEQSPIDLLFAASSNVAPIEFFYKPTPLVIVNNGHTIQVNYQPGSMIKVGGDYFELLQFHFHSPSEHTVEGGFYGMEMHFVHKSPKGELGVIGVFLAHGKANEALQRIWDHMPLQKGGPVAIDGQVIDANVFLPADKRYFAYPGSLTTPPCSEGVSWHVIRDPINVSPEQISKFREVVGENNRPTQPLNHRILRISRE